MKRLLALAVLAPLAGAACSKAPPPAHTANGVVKEIAADRRSALIAHEEFPGFMEAMTMTFSVADPALLEGVEPGDAVTLTITQDGRRWPVTALSKRAEGAAAKRAGPCVRGDPAALKVRWRAFKTPKKVGVEGLLLDIEASGPREAKTWKELVLAQTLTIGAGPRSVSSGDATRDAKISKFFFGELAGAGAITAKAARVDEAGKKLVVAVTLNGVTREVPMSYERKDASLTAKGRISVLDFAGGKALASITAACRELHEGKTWPEVEIGLAAEFVSCR